jgi:hypothetical protein
MEGRMAQQVSKPRRIIFLYTDGSSTYTDTSAADTGVGKPEQINKLRGGHVK